MKLEIKPLNPDRWDDLVDRGVAQALLQGVASRRGPSCDDRCAPQRSRGMTGETRPPSDGAPPKARILDIGAGDPEAPANAIPNIIAHLVETETWRNAATVIMGGLLIGLGYWAYNGVRDSIAETRVTGLEALLGTVVKGLDVWVGEHTRRSRARGEGSGGGRARRAARGGHAAPGCGAGTLHGRGRGPRADGAVVVVDAGRGRVPDHRPRRASCSHRRIPRAAGSACARGAFRQRLDLALDGTPQFVRPYPETGALRPSAVGSAPSGRLVSGTDPQRAAARRSPRWRSASTPTASSRRCSPRRGPGTPPRRTRSRTTA